MLTTKAVTLGKTDFVIRYFKTTKKEQYCDNQEYYNTILSTLLTRLNQVSYMWVGL